MNIDVKTIEGAKVKQIALPAQFSEPYEPGLIARALAVIRNNQRQPYGAMYMAGIAGVSAKLSRRRRNYKGSYGHSISRAPRKTTWRRGMQFGWVGALAPGTRGGRRSHPPKAERDWSLKINKKEKQKAIRSALSVLATQQKMVVVENKFETLAKTQDLSAALVKLGFQNELARLNETKIRPGIGKLRGRRHRTKQGPLLIVAKKSPVEQAAKNLPGIETIHVQSLNTLALTHGSEPRQTIWSEEALQLLTKNNLYMH